MVNDKNSIEKRRGGNPTQKPLLRILHSSIDKAIDNEPDPRSAAHNAEVLAPHPGTAIIVDDNTSLA
jgi:hypothetical protein